MLCCVCCSLKGTESGKFFFCGGGLLYHNLFYVWLAALLFCLVTIRALFFISQRVMYRRGEKASRPFAYAAFLVMFFSMFVLILVIPSGGMIVGRNYRDVTSVLSAPVEVRGVTDCVTTRTFRDGSPHETVRYAPEKTGKCGVYRR